MYARFKWLDCEKAAGLKPAAVVFWQANHRESEFRE